MLPQALASIYRKHIIFVLSIVNFNLHYNLNRKRLHIWHAYSTNDTLLNDTKVDDLMFLTVALRKK